MAKLSDEVKAASKLAAKARDKAYRSRRKEYELAVQSANEAALMSNEYAAMIAASEKFDASSEKIRLIKDKLNIELKAIQSKIISLNFDMGLDSLNNARNKTHLNYSHALEVEMNKVKSSFQDIEGVWSAPVWDARVALLAKGDQK